MFDTNIRWDQQGPVRFMWSLRSHAGNWQAGKADQFGWDILNPLLARVTAGKRKGSLPAATSFMRIDKPNVICSTLKPAEANGAGFIVRFNETLGTGTTATVAFPFVSRLTSATETDLVENDRPAPLAVRHGNEVTFAIPPFGVKTIRFVSAPRMPAEAPSACQASALLDMQVKLSWQVKSSAARNISHYNVYRGTKPDFEPSLLHLVARPASTSYTDQPQLHYGGWINNRLEPATTYYYRVAAVDRWNNESPLSAPVAATTLKSSVKNLAPLRVEGLRAILVSPISPQNFVNLLFRTGCESDVQRYELHRSTQAGFAPTASTRIGCAEASALVKGSTVYGHVPLDYRMRDYDHMMFQDDTVQPGTTYRYRVCAVDSAGQRGPFSAEASARTKEKPAPGARITAQSVYAPEYAPENAVDGDPDPYAAWISKPYGGGTKDKPLDVWWTIELPAGKQFQCKGVKVVRDDRDIIPLQKALQAQVREGQGWKTIGQTKDATTRTFTLPFPEPISIDALRVFVPATDLPNSAQADIDGIVRICELLLILPDGQESPIAPLLK